MDIELLRTLNYCLAILGPIWIIGPLMRRGVRYWYVLLAFFLLFAYSNYCTYADRFGIDGALLRALAFAGFVMLLGYVWAVTMNRYEAGRKSANTAVDAK